MAAPPRAAATPAAHRATARRALRRLRPQPRASRTSRSRRADITCCGPTPRLGQLRRGLRRGPARVWATPIARHLRADRPSDRDGSSIGPVGVMDCLRGLHVHWLLATSRPVQSRGQREPFTTVMADYGAGDSAARDRRRHGLRPGPREPSPGTRAPRVPDHAQSGPLAAPRRGRRPPLPTDPFGDRLHGAADAGVTAEMAHTPEYHVMFVNGRPDRRIDRLRGSSTGSGGTCDPLPRSRPDGRHAPSRTDERHHRIDGVKVGMTTLSWGEDRSWSGRGRCVRRDGGHAARRDRRAPVFAGCHR